MYKHIDTKTSFLENSIFLYWAKLGTEPQSKNPHVGSNKDTYSYLPWGWFFRIFVHLRKTQGIGSSGHPRDNSWYWTSGSSPRSHSWPEYLISGLLPLFVLKNSQGPGYMGVHAVIRKISVSWIHLLWRHSSQLIRFGPVRRYSQIPL